MDRHSDEYITLSAANALPKASELYPYGSRNVPIDPSEEQLIGELVSRDPSKGAQPTTTVEERSKIGAQPVCNIPDEVKYPLCEVCWHHHPVGSNHLD